ncbi:hypothetical protein DFJ63DRAFT_316469 [Scheffersomyces coipomensis]|uniref:uncharacterized protein n=1 Tax=Scheffersomyces coipomensis TaxID=1788519 RepID=UPI00315DBC50
MSTTTTTNTTTSTIKSISQLSNPTILPIEGYTKPIAFTTNILIVGGSYSGLSCLKSLKNHFKHRCSLPQYSKVLLSPDDDEIGQTQTNYPPKRVSITLIEPKSGLLNVIGIPQSIVDPKFAESQYLNYDNLKGLKFDKIISQDLQIINQFHSRLNKRNSNSIASNSTASDDIEYDETYSIEDDIDGVGNLQFGFEINFIHGKVTYLDDNKAQYSLTTTDSNSSDLPEKAMIDFDYVILATGKDRSWPTTPLAYIPSYFINEMIQSYTQIENHNIISIIGAGAVGIELASDIKRKFPLKTVNLIHPHENFPPEPLSLEFKQKVKETLIKSKVNLILNTRIKEESSNGDLITSENKIIHSNLNYWCNSHKSNIEILSTPLLKQFKTAQNNLLINDYLQLSNTITNHTIENFFVIGDLIEKPIIKSAGWAAYTGRQIANNLVSYLLDSKFIEPFPDVSLMPRGMVILGGDGNLVSELSGVVELNNASYVEEYKDYCFGKIKATLDV